MNDKNINSIVEALKKAPEVDFGIYQIIFTDKMPRKVTLIPMSGKSTKYVI